jgi:hypothetical protein
LRARQPSISAHHAFSALRSVRGCLAFHTRISSSSAWPASPTIGRSTRTFLLIELGSMSMWIFLECGENSVSLPVMRSSKRAPILISTSQ